MSRPGDWIQTRSGGQFWPLDPRPDEIHIEDIAHALSNQCRFTGHTSEFYSVAHHSILVSRHCDPADALWGLLHDAAEAYIVDLPRPIKQMPGFEVYSIVERDIMAVICRKFGLPAEMPTSVKRVDELLLATEARDLMSPLHPEWARWIGGMPTLPERIVPWTPPTARRVFLVTFERLIELRGVA